MADVSNILASNVIAFDRDEERMLADALTNAIDRALGGLTADPLAGQPAEDYAAACDRVERAFASCRTDYRDQPWALTQIEALIARLCNGLANACAAGRFASAAVEHRL